MKNILVTGATGNVGREVLRFLFSFKHDFSIIAAVRNIDKAKQQFKEYPELKFVDFDFEFPETFENAFNNIDRVFLLRPPHISDTEKYFKPIINMIQKCGIKKIVFLSVFGVEKSKIIPHNSIEKLVKKSGLKYIFLRPSYFMQNLFSLTEIVDNKKVIQLPASESKFNWIDIKDIAEIAAIALLEENNDLPKIIKLTGAENLSFGEVVSLINDRIKSGKKIEYQAMNPICFYRLCKRKGLPASKIIVMILLHYLPRFQSDPKITNDFERITSKKPTSVVEFIEREIIFFEK